MSTVAAVVIVVLSLHVSPFNIAFHLSVNGAHKKQKTISFAFVLHIVVCESICLIEKIDCDIHTHPENGLHDILCLCSMYISNDFASAISLKSNTRSY